MPASTTTRNDLRTFGALCLATLGVVYGDIGTSPLYTVSEIFFGPSAIPYTPQNALGATSLVLWILTLSVTLKYILLVLRANHEGQGGTFALLALIQRSTRASASGRHLPGGAPLLGGVGLALVLEAALLFGEGIITPAISVLSAVEGLNIVTHAFEPFVVPATALILVAFFSIQRRGTARIGALFGPAITLWFLVIAGLGIIQLVRQPGILRTIDPRSAIAFLSANGRPGSVAVLGSVLLAFTFMTTWQWGRQRVAGVYADLSPQCETIRRFLELKQKPSVPQLPRSVVVMSSKPVLNLDGRIPPALHFFWTRLGALPKHVILLTVRQVSVPNAHTAEAPRTEAITFLSDPASGPSSASSRRTATWRRPMSVTPWWKPSNCRRSRCRAIPGGGSCGLNSSRPDASPPKLSTNECGGISGCAWRWNPEPAVSR